MKKSYMIRLERWARWTLPQQEAEEVIADYRDIVGTPPRLEEELIRDLGKPRNVAMQLTTAKAYRIWLAVFIALSACLLTAALAPLPVSPFFRLFLWYQWGGGYKWGDPEFTILTVLPALQLTAGTILCLVWFLRRKDKAGRPLPKGLVLCALLMLAGIVLAWRAVWSVFSAPEQFMTVWTIDESFIGEGISAAYRGKSPPAAIAMNGRLEWGGCALAGLVGMIALVKARTRDRRWAAVYLLALTLAVLALAVLGMVWNLAGITPHESFVDGWFRPYLPRFATLTALGLVGAGVSLC